MKIMILLIIIPTLIRLWPTARPWPTVPEHYARKVSGCRLGPNPSPTTLQEKPVSLEGIAGF